MAETSGEAREGGNVKVEREVETEIRIGKDDEGGESIEMRTARDAKAVPSRGVGVGVGVPLEHHLTPDQLANLTLESRRIKVLHTNLIPKHLPNKNPNFKKKSRERKTPNIQIEIFRCGTNPPISTSRSQVRPARVHQPPLRGTPTASPPSKSMFGWGKSKNKI